MSYKVLVINCGSSSLKFAVIDAANGEVSFKGLAERLGSTEAVINFKTPKGNYGFRLIVPTHAGAIASLVPELHKQDPSLSEDIIAVGHRIVHGGELFKESRIVDATVKTGISDCFRLAPLHNPAHLAGILAAEQAFPDLPQVVVFDTAFHQRMDEAAYLYALPYQYYEKFALRRYGAHGSSYRYITQRMCEILGTDHPKLVICHLGNGASLAAVDTDHSVDTTMGLTPLEGVVHGTRCGDIDPTVPEFLCNALDKSIAEVTSILWKESGLLGLSGISNDFRSIVAEAEKNNEAAIRTIKVYAYRLAKHMASMLMAVQGGDAIVFTGGIGENSAYLRRLAMEYFAYQGYQLDHEANEKMCGGAEGLISIGEKKVYVVPTNEELMIARDAVRLVKGEAV